MAKTVFIKRGDMELGPFDFNEAQELLRNGNIQAHDQMKAAGDTQWKPAEIFLKSVGLLAAGVALGAIGATLLSNVGNAAQAATPDAASAIAGGATVGGVGPEIQVDSYDFNGDGVSDLDLIDTNGDGVADIHAYDFNGDGLADVVEVDIDGDGVMDVVWEFVSGIFGG